MSDRWTASGACGVGVGVNQVTPHEGYGMSGYSWIGKKGKKGKDSLYARALCIKDNANDTLAVICVVDLVCPSLALTAAVARKIEQHASLKNKLKQEQVMLLGTHTHSAPGHHQYNSFFRLFAQRLSGLSLQYQAKWVNDLAGQITTAIASAVNDIKPGWVGIDRTCRLWKQSSNRSLKAFNKGPHHLDWNNPDFPGHLADDELDPKQKAVDPRITTIVARQGGAPRAAFAWFGCHATALGPKQKKYHRDWPGYAVYRLESKYANFHAAVGLSASGDVSPLPPKGLKKPRSHQGKDLARKLGRSVADCVAESIDASAAESPGDLKVRVCAGAWSPADEIPRLDWQVGYPSLGGAEDGRSDLSSCFPEGQRKSGSNSTPQDPKLSALGIIQDILDALVLDLACWHPWYRFTLGGHALVTVPGEATTLAAFTLEQCASNLPDVTHATVISYGGDYAGYFTTAGEYECQHYEGSMTLYGRMSLTSLGAAVTGKCGTFEFPDYPEVESNEEALTEIVQGLSTSPVLISVPVGRKAREQVFVLWIGKKKDGRRQWILQDDNMRYVAGKVFVASKMFKDVIKSLKKLPPETGDAVLAARFPGVATQRPRITPGGKSVQMYYDSKNENKPVKLRDLRPTLE